MKGRRPDAETVTVSKNEWLASLNKRGQYYLAIVFVDDGVAGEPVFVRDPVRGSHEFGVTSVNLRLAQLIESVPV